MSEKVNRVALASLFIALLLLLCAYYNINHALYEQYPDNAAVIFDNGCDGPVSVSVHGTVLDTDGDGFTLRLTHGSASKLLKVLSQEGVPPVACGDRVEVLGVRNSDELVPATMIVSKQWSHYAVYIRSVAGLAITMVVFFRYWTFDFRALQFRRREENDKDRKEREGEIENA
jgi:hypothetical protein